MSRLYPLVADTRNNATTPTIAAGQSVTVRVQVDAHAGNFTIRRLIGAAFTAVLIGSAPSGTPCPVYPDPDSAASPLPTLQQVRYAIKIGQDQQQAPLLMSTVSAVGALAFEPAALPVCPAAQWIDVTFYNDSAYAIRAVLELHGTYDQ